MMDKISENAKGASAPFATDLCHAALIGLYLYRDYQRQHLRAGLSPAKALSDLEIISPSLYFLWLTG